MDIEYPRWKYNRVKGGRIIASPEEEAELDGDWVDSPLQLGVITCPSEFQEDYDPDFDQVPTKRGPGRPPKVQE